jgi:hypothetical protein
MILLFLPFWIRLSLALIPVKKTDRILITAMVADRKKTFKYANSLLRTLETIKRDRFASRAQRRGLLRAIRG